MLNYLLHRKEIQDREYGLSRPPQIFDLLRLSRKEKDCKAQCRLSIRKLEEWKKSNHAVNQTSKTYLRIEGLMRRRQAEDAVLLYRMIKREREKRFRIYLESLPDRSRISRAAS
jgi:hypothetical protein